MHNPPLPSQQQLISLRQATKAIGVSLRIMDSNGRLLADVVQNLSLVGEMHQQSHNQTQQQQHKQQEQQEQQEQHQEHQSHRRQASNQGGYRVVRFNSGNKDSSKTATATTATTATTTTTTNYANKDRKYNNKDDAIEQEGEEEAVIKEDRSTTSESVGELISRINCSLQRNARILRPTHYSASFRSGLTRQRRRPRSQGSQATDTPSINTKTAETPSPMAANSTGKELHYQVNYNDLEAKQDNSTSWPYDSLTASDMPTSMSYSGSKAEAAAVCRRLSHKYTRDIVCHTIGSVLDRQLQRLLLQQSSGLSLKPLS